MQTTGQIDDSVASLKAQNAALEAQLEEKTRENAALQERIKEIPVYNQIFWKLVRAAHQCDVRDILRQAEYEIPFDILRRMPSEICLTTVVFKNQGSVINCMEAISRKYVISEVEKIAVLNNFTDYEKFAARYIAKVDYYHNRPGRIARMQQFFDLVGYKNFMRDFSAAKTKFLQNHKWGTNLYDYESPADSYDEYDDEYDSDSD